MELNKYDPIKNLNTTRFDWKCRLRLQSCWKGINRQTKEFFGMNMLFIDDSLNTTNDFIQKEILGLLNVYMLIMTADKVICVCRTGAYLSLIHI